MAATRSDSQRPHPPLRTESFQKMLDLEKQFKLARIQSSQMSPRSDQALQFQPQTNPPPIQARRRTSRESLAGSHQGGESSLPPSRRSNTMPSLSITIPPVGETRDKQVVEQTHIHHTNGIHVMTLENAENGQATSSEEDDVLTPRESTSESLRDSNGRLGEENEGGDVGEEEDDEEDSDDARSEQSSICQSPSWEGYSSQKKKDKKKKQEAEQKKRDKSKTPAEQESKAAKKKGANRLFKFPPSEGLSSPTATGWSRPISSASARPASNSNKPTGRMTPIIHQMSLLDGWSMVSGSGLGSTTNMRLPYSYSSSATRKSEEIKTAPQQEPAGESVNSTPAETATELSTRATVVASNAVATANANASNIIPDTTSASASTLSCEKTSYPPKSSRTRALKNALPTTKLARRNSITSMTATSNISDPSLNIVDPVAFECRSRMSTDSAVNGSYVRKSRAQSVERSVGGYMQEASFASSLQALTNPTSQTDQPQFRQAASAPLHKRSASQSTVLDLSLKVQRDVNAITTEANGHLSQSAQPLSQPQQEVVPNKEPALTSAAEDGTEKSDGSEVDYYNFVTSPYTPPSLDLTTPAVGAGILSSIKSRINRRSSASSVSAPGAARSFKERAMGAIHLPTPSSTNNLPSKSSSTAAATALASETHPEKTATNTSTGLNSSMAGTKHVAASASQTEGPRLPKPVRILGELNAEIMSRTTKSKNSRPSEGSSTSSYHDDSSTPPSPASTPDTSRPQSAKGLAATIDEIRFGSPNMFQEDAVTSANALPQRDAPPDLSPPERSTARAKSGDNPGSKGRLIENLERPVSRGRLLENVERPGSNGRVFEAAKPSMPQEESSGSSTIQREAGAATTTRRTPTKRDGIVINDDSSQSFANGLGILDQAYSQTAPVPENDEKSFATSSPTSHDPKLPHEPQPDNALDEKNVVSEDGGSHNKAALASSGAENGTELSQQQHQQQQQPEELPASRNAHRKKEKRNGSHAKHMSIVREEPKQDEEILIKQQQQNQQQENIGQDSRKSAVNFHAPSSTINTRRVHSQSMPPPPRNATGLVSTLAKAATMPPQVTFLSGRNSPSAMYLQEARRSAPLVSSPLSNVIHSSRAAMSTSALVRTASSHGPALLHQSASRPELKSKAAMTFSNSSPAGETPQPQSPPASGSISSSPAPSPTQAQETGLPLARPMAKMLVECCHCKFFHDMPSRVYECMAQPDAVVTDRDLGVSGAITTMVKCPWCSHNMSTQCCAGYAAVVYLKEKLH